MANVIKELFKESALFVKYGISSMIFPAPHHYPKIKSDAKLDQQLLDSCINEYKASNNFEENYLKFFAVIARNKLPDLHAEWKVSKKKVKDLRKLLGSAKDMKDHNAIRAELIKYKRTQEKLFEKIKKQIHADVWLAVDEVYKAKLKEWGYSVYPRTHEFTEKDFSLDGITIAKRDNDDKIVTDTQDAEHIFYLMGNVHSREGYYDEMVTDIGNAKREGFDLIAHAINPRGVLKSSGEAKIAEDLIEDYVTIIKEQIESLNIKPHKITIKGHSLGAGYGSVVAARLHAEGYTVNFFDGSSFARTNVAIDLGLGESIQKIASTVISKSGWDIDSLSAFLSIPEQYRTHFVRKDGKEGRELDGVISYKGSLHYALKAARKEEKKFIKNTQANIRILAKKFSGYSINELLNSGKNDAIRSRLDQNPQHAAYIMTISESLKLLEQWYALEVDANVDFFKLSLSKLNDQLDKLFQAKFKGHQMVGGNHNASLSEIKSAGLGIDGNEFFIKSVKNRREFFEKQAKNPTSSFEQLKHAQERLQLIETLLVDNTNLLTSSIQGFRQLLFKDANVKIADTATVEKINNLVFDLSNNRISAETFIGLFKAHTGYQGKGNELLDSLNIRASNKNFAKVNLDNLAIISHSLKEAGKHINVSRHRVLAKLRLPLPQFEFNSDTLQNISTQVRALVQAHIVLNETHAASSRKEKTDKLPATLKKVEQEALKQADNYLTVLQLQAKYVAHITKQALKKDEKSDIAILQPQLANLKQQLKDWRDAFPDYALELLGKKGSDINTKFAKVTETMQQSQEQLQSMIDHHLNSPEQTKASVLPSKEPAQTAVAEVTQHQRKRIS